MTDISKIALELEHLCSIVQVCGGILIGLIILVTIALWIIAAIQIVKEDDY